MATLPDSSTSSALVCSDERVLMSSVLGASLDTTISASIALFYASLDTRRLSVDPYLYKLSSHHESSPEVDEINSSSLPITSPFPLSQSCLDFILTAPGEN